MRLPTLQKLLRVAVIVAGSGALGASCLHFYQRQACADLQFVRRGYACEAHDLDTARSYASLENDVRTQLGRAQTRGDLLRSSVHYQRLRDGSGFHVNDDATFAPASMLKLPAMVALFVLEERTPGTLQKQLLYTPEQARTFSVPEQIEVAATGLQRGKTYTIEELMHATIAYSDNLAYYILLSYINADPEQSALLTRTFRELGIQDPHDFEDQVASVREYAGVFRMLYNASYLDAAASEKLLSWLGESTYDKGIAAGTGQGTPVANKFGERVLADGTRELHDCGIVYNSEDPYVLCIMTQGKEFATLQNVIADISNSIYESATKRAL